MPRKDGSPRDLVLAAVLAFAAFGAFWGAWGASIPTMRAQAGLDDSQLGVALLFVAVGAVPAMLFTGRAIDRWGLRVAAVAIAALGVSGVIVALAGQNLVSLSAALTLVGVTSGASDVAQNSVAGRAERDAGRPVITRAHAVFSTFVVTGSLGTGLLTSIGAPTVTAFVLVAGTAGVAATLMTRSLPTHRSHRAASCGISPNGRPQSTAGAGHTTQVHTRTLPTMSLFGFGLLGALAFASENAHQSWSAIFITEALSADVATGSLAPAIFAAAVAATRFAAGGIGTAHARVVLAAGSAAAAAGALIVSTAPNVTLSLLGLVTAAAGTAVLFPTILGVVSARVEEAYRGRATSTMSTVAYLGFLLSPVYVGFWSGAVGIRGAMLAVAALGVLLLLLTPMVKPAPSSMTPATSRVGHSHSDDVARSR